MASFTIPDDLHISDNIFDDLLEDLEYEDFGDFAVLADDQMVVESTDLDAFQNLAKVPVAQPNSLTMDESSHTSAEQDSDGTGNLRKYQRTGYSDVSISKHPGSAQTSPVVPAPQNAGVGHPMTHFPVSLFKAFNGGDLAKVRELVEKNTAKTVALRTPSLDDDVVGQEHIINLFSYIFDSHPDAVWVAKNCRCMDLVDADSRPALDPAGAADSPMCLIRCKIYFAGTRVRSTGASGVPFARDYSYLFKRPHASLLDEMDVSLLSPQEVSAMRILEQKGKNLCVFGKGSWVLCLNRQGTITRMEFNWVVSSFREADI